MHTHISQPGQSGVITRTNNITQNRKIIQYNNGALQSNEQNQKHHIQNSLCQEDFTQGVKVSLGVESTKRIFDKDSELAKLLQMEKGDPRLTYPHVKFVQKSMKKQTRHKDKSATLTKSLLLDLASFKPLLTIPPPPPGSLPQPSITSGT